MKKSDLKENMVVQYREGELRVFKDGKLEGLDGFNHLIDYNEDLVSVPYEGNSIDKIYLSEGESLEKMLNANNLKLIWDRNKSMKELTFREVIANIKEGEVWVWKDFTIELYKEEITIRFKQEEGLAGIYFDNNTKFKLKPQEIDFQKAFELYEEGKTIQSLVTGCKCIKGNLDLCVGGSEIKGKWIVIE